MPSPRRSSPRSSSSRSAAPRATSWRDRLAGAVAALADWLDARRPEAAAVLVPVPVRAGERRPGSRRA